ncbi:hypothetical protein UFOVP605_19 [uncultured Caudovirales phage]|uniref:Uncharacterized protein n=1 Tax=uncultured Caudovirales phage TaxID=2100421 RepID=A0A6J5N1T8_9CAUD|nr:hypothetical protein UFOVP605_19 [uncultured Caudovirales phage]
MKVQIEWNNLLIEADVDVEPVIVGKHWGRPEDCTPDEGGEITLNKLMMGEVDMFFLLECDKFGEEIMRLIEEEVDAYDGEW